MAKVNEPHTPRVTLVVLHQVPAVAISFWVVSRGYHVEAGVQLGI